MTMPVSEQEQQERRDEWLSWVRELLGDVRKWAERRGWAVREDHKPIREQSLGEYTAPTLRIRTPHGELYADPVGRDMIGAEGRVDLEAWPSLNRVRLIRAQGQWRVITDSNVPLREPWGERTFAQLAVDLSGRP